MALQFEQNDLNDCAPIMLDIMGKYEKYQNSGDLEGIDSILGFAIQFDSQVVSLA